jgi:hypothetical protein
MRLIRDAIPEWIWVWVWDESYTHDGYEYEDNDEYNFIWYICDVSTGEKFSIDISTCSQTYQMLAASGDLEVK